MKSFVRSGLRLLVVASLLLTTTAPVASAATPTDLFISEYIEGSTGNKAIELYNGTASAVDLGAGNYQIAQYFDGAVAPSQLISLTGTVAPNAVHVVANNAANAAILGQADQVSGSLSFNGNDVVVLRKGAQGTTLDAIGQIGSSPGTGWGADPTNTMDNTLVRKATISTGDTNPNDAFDPAADWTGHPIDTVSFLGSHSVATASAGVDATVTIAESAACLELSTSTIDFGSLALGAQDQLATPTIGVQNCSTNAETLLARGTDASGTGASWNLVDSAATCAGSLGLDNYRLSLMSPGIPAPISLATTNKTIQTLSAGESRNHDAHIWTACPGSSGAGEVMTFQIHFLVTSP